MVRAAGRLISKATALVAATPTLPPFKEGTFRSRLHDEAPAAWLGVALGVTFTVCFATGLLSHFIQNPAGFFSWPARPVGLYRVTQGLHVVTGLASIPLLLFKLFVVYPHLWSWPPVRGVAHAVERAVLPALVGGSLFLLVTGVQNVTYWYPWGFFFPPAHYWAAWITIGALIVHIAAKVHIVRRVAARREPGPDRRPRRAEAGGLSRRGVLVAARRLTTAGTTVRPLERLLLSPRRPSVGPVGFPSTAPRAARRRRPAWTLRVEGRVCGCRWTTCARCRNAPRCCRSPAWRPSVETLDRRVAGRAAARSAPHPARRCSRRSNAAGCTARPG